MDPMRKRPTKAPSLNSLRSGLGLATRDPATVALEAAARRSEQARDFAAQHGPVRVLVKDGQPVQRR